MSAPATETLIELVIAARPDLAGAPVERFDSGFDFIALSVGDMIFRFPRDAEGEAALRREAAILDAIRPRLTMAVPKLTLIEGAAVFSAHPALPGRTLLTEDYLALPQGARDRLGADLGRFLGEMHLIPPALTAGFADGETRVWPTAEQLEASALPHLPQGFHGIARAQLASYAALPPDPLGEAFSHFDAHGWNMAFDPISGRLNGIFDFGDARIGPVHEDWLCPSMIHPDLATNSMAAYEALTGRRLDRARIEALTSAQRLDDLAGMADYPDHAETTLRLALDWFAHLAAAA